jgi:hypothetical protein
LIFYFLLGLNTQDSAEVSLTVSLVFLVIVFFYSVIFHDLNRAGVSRMIPVLWSKRTILLKVNFSPDGLSGDLKVPMKCISDVALEGTNMLITINNHCPFQSGTLNLEIVEVRTKKSPLEELVKNFKRSKFEQEISDNTCRH